MTSLMLSGCAAPTTIRVIELPPGYLYEGGCGAPEALQRGASNGDLVRYVRGLQNAVAGCEIDRAAIREWAEGMEKAKL